MKPEIAITASMLSMFSERRFSKGKTTDRS